MVNMKKERGRRKEWKDARRREGGRRDGGWMDSIRIIAISYILLNNVKV